MSETDHDRTRRPPDAIDRHPLGWLGIGMSALAAVASLATIALGARDLFNLDGPGWALVLAYFTVALILGCLSAVFALQVRHNRWFLQITTANERKIANLRELYQRRAAVDLAMPSVHRAHHLLRDASYAAMHDEPTSAAERLAASLAEMANAFSNVTGSTCRASIKLLELAADAPDEIDPLRKPEYLYVSTLCRHDHTNPPSTRGPDPLEGNTDFMQVWDIDTPGTCFWSNDLDLVDPYENTHRRNVPRSKWAYNATMVWPIQKAEIGTPDGTDEIGFDMLGFFCVDSLERDVFRYDNDFHLGAGYADALYTHLATRNFVSDLAKLASGDPARIQE